METKTFKKLGLTESYIRAVRPSGWQVCQDSSGNKYAVREK